jgi:transcriptional regulator GlxA family with amidase domain
MSSSSLPQKRVDAASGPTPNHASRTVAITVFPRGTLLDIVGPYESLWRVPGVTVHLVSASGQPVRCGGGATLCRHTTFAECPRPDVLIVPGGPGTAEAAHDEELLAYIRDAAPHLEWLASVCSGTLVLAEAGVITGKRASTYWLSREQLATHGVEVSTDRVTFDGRFASSAGVSAGIDLGLRLAARLSDDLTAHAIQLGMEYAPEPPYELGHQGGGPPAAVRQRFDELRQLWFAAAPA